METKALTTDHYAYRVTWSPGDGEFVGLCAEFPSLSWREQLLRTPFQKYGES